MRTSLFSIAGLLSLGLASQAADHFHSDFTEATLGEITGLNKDSPATPTQDFSLNDAADTLDFVTTDANMWTVRANAPIAWVDAPTATIGETWSVETYVSMEKGGNEQEVAGITFYGGPDGARPDFGFSLDDWNDWQVTLQGLGDNNPRVNGSDLGTATGVFLRVEVTEGGTTDTYNFFWKVNSGDAWTQLGEAAINFASSFANSRVGLVLKSDGDGGAAQFDYLTVTEAAIIDDDNDNLSDNWEMAQTGYVDLTTFDGLITDPMGASGAGSGDFDGDGLTDIKEYDPGAPFLPFIDSTDAGDDDSDDDTLLDGVETRTGIFVSASDTGTNPNSDDTDADGLFDAEETGDGVYDSPTDTGSDPNKPDTDGDTLDDGLEVLALGLPYNPNTDDSGSDFDSDNATLAVELTNRTDYLDPDSDGDNLLDGDEITNGTNPLNPDTDTDGLQDDVETNDGSFDGPSDTGTDPINPDSDGDGWPDGAEVGYGTDPNLIGEFPNPMGVPTVNLIQDLDAEMGVTSASPPLVDDWLNQAASGGDDVSFLGGGTGDAQLLAGATPTGLAAVDFNGGDKLVGDDPAAFDHIIQGSGLTWLAVVKVGDNDNLNNKSRIFGTLINTTPYSGYIANINNVELLGSVFRPGPTAGAQFQVDSTTGLNDGNWHVVGGRVAAGTGDQTQEVFIDSAVAEGSGLATVKMAADSGALSVGTERTSGGEYGIFTLARLLIYDRPLVDAELTEAVSFLNTTYIGSAAAGGPVLSIDSLVGTTLSMTVTGATDTEYICKSGTDLLSFPDTETTTPGTVMTDGSGTVSFSIDIGARTELFLQAEEVAP